MPIGAEFALHRFSVSGQRDAVLLDVTAPQEAGGQQAQEREGDGVLGVSRPVVLVGESEQLAVALNLLNVLL